MTEPFDPLSPIMRALAASQLKVFLFAFDSALLNRAMVQEFFDTRTEIKNWMSNFEGSVLAVSDRSVGELQKMLHERFPLSLFIVTETTIASSGGWLPGNVWDFIARPTPSQKTKNLVSLFVDDLLKEPPKKEQS